MKKTWGVLIIYRATNQTVMFEKVDYIRVGSYTKKLNEYPALSPIMGQNPQHKI